MAAGRVPSESESHGWDYLGYVGENIFEAQQGLRLTREAFAIVLYHFWEREACHLLAIKSYNQQKIFVAAQADPRFSDDEVGIDRLRLIVNCLKHDNGFDLHSPAPELFSSNILPSEKGAAGWQTALTLRDDDLDTALAAVSASGPRSNSVGGEIEDLCP